VDVELGALTGQVGLTAIIPDRDKGVLEAEALRQEQICDCEQGVP
jgi:hypothetical protein